MRVGQRPHNRRLDALVLGDRLRQRGGVEICDLAVIALPECGGVGLGLRNVGVDRGIVDSLEEIA